MKKEKVHYGSKKDAVHKLNYILKNPNHKKRPVRVYEDETGWHLTKIEVIDNMSLVDLIKSAIRYSDGKKYYNKRDWEDECKLRNLISKIIIK